MTGWNLQLTEEQIDSLKEVGNIGAGHAASRLAGLIGKACLVSVPELVCTDAEGIKKVFEMNDSLGVALHIRVLGDIPASMVVVTGRAQAELMLHYMNQVSSLSEEAAADADFRLALKQLGEVLTRSFSEAISQFLDAKLHCTLPEVVLEDWSTAVNGVLEQSGDSADSQMAIQAEFCDQDKSVNGKFVYILGPQAQTMVLKRLEKLFS